MGEPVNIVGAGPAGLTAAIVLRRHGIPVRVFEKAADVGHRLNGDYQGFENWSAEQHIPDLFRELSIEPNFLCAPFFEGSICAPGMAPVRVTSRRAIFYLVKRGAMPDTLDFGLKAQAQALGAELLFNREFDSAPGRTIIGTGPRGVDAIASGVTFATTHPDTALVVFDDAIAPKGYAYLLIHGGHGTAATVMYRGFDRERECFDRMRERFSAIAGVDLGSGAKFVSYANFFIPDTLVKGDRLYVGEAAGFQDCLWGFGMRYAVMSGYLAARSIIDGTDYDLLWQRELKPLLETSLVNRYLLERFGAIGYRYLVRRFAQGTPCAYLRHHYNRSFFKQCLLPLARREQWRRQHPAAPTLLAPHFSPSPDGE